MWTKSNYIMQEMSKTNISSFFKSSNCT